jgi:hypothetical protein
MRKAGLMQQPSESLNPDRPLPDVLMAIEL